MPIVLKSVEEAKRHLIQSSREIAENLRVLQGNLELKDSQLSQAVNLMGRGLDEVHTQCFSTWAAIEQLKETGEGALKGVSDVQAICTTHAENIQQIVEASDSVETIALEAKSDATLAKRTAQSNLSAAQDAQHRASQFCLIFKGIPQNLSGGKESYRQLITAFEEAMKEISLGKLFEPKSLKRLMKRKTDKSTRPPHVRVELSSINHRILIFDQIKAHKARSGRATSFSVAPDIPKYALSKHNTLHRIAEIARDSEFALLTRVSLGRGKWPELQSKNEAGEWGPIPQDIFDKAKAEYNEQQRQSAESRKAARKQASGSSDMEVDGRQKASRSTQGTRNPRLPDKSTPVTRRRK